MTAPTPTPVASVVATMNVIWLAPRPMARGAISVSTWRDWVSDKSMLDDGLKLVRISGRHLDRRWNRPPMTTPMASDSTPRMGPSSSAPPMIARL